MEEGILGDTGAQQGMKWQRQTEAAHRLPAWPLSGLTLENLSGYIQGSRELREGAWHVGDKLL